MDGKPESAAVDAGINETAAAVIGQTESNLDAAAVINPEPTAAKKKDWRLEPLSNFELDGAGELILVGGEPKRRHGKPRKPMRGDKLAGGGVFGIEPSAAVDAGEPAAEPAAAPGDETLGDEAGDVLAEALFGFGQAVAGEKAKPKPAEDKAVKKSLSRSLSGVTFPPIVAAVVFIGAYCGRVFWELRRQKTPNRQGSANGAPGDASIRGGNDAQRKNDVSQVPSYDYR